MTDPPPLRGLLAQLAERQDAASWEAVVGRYMPVIRTAVASVIADPSDAADCLQDVLMRLPRAVRRFKIPAGTRSVEAMETLWVQRLSLNAAIDCVRSRDRRSRRIEPVRPDEAVAPASADAGERHELSSILHAALAALHQTQRDVLIMHYFQGLDHAAIAAQTRCSPGASRARLHRAMETIRGLMADRGHVLGVAALAGLLSGMGGSLQAATAAATTPAALAAAKTAAAGIPLPPRGSWSGLDGPSSGPALAKAALAAALVAALVAGAVGAASRPIASSIDGYAPKAGRMTTPWTAAVDPRAVLTEHPRPQLARERWQSLNGVWEFAPAQPGDPLPTGRTLRERILVPFPVEAPLSGVMRAEERMWYRRTFALPPGWAGERVLLHFGAVDYEATVAVNGHMVGRHRGGYGAFDFDITDELVAGTNELIVNVVDLTDGAHQAVGKQSRTPDGWWFTAFSGIWQTVWLEPVPARRIADLELEPQAGAGVVRITVRGHDADGEPVAVRVLDHGRVVAEAAGAEGEPLMLTIPQARRWSPDDPYLYDVSVSLLRDGRAVDTVASYVGLRSIGLGEAGGRTRPLLDGRFVFQSGVLDQGYWPDGVATAPTDAALRADLERVKAFGFNAVRKHCKVEPARWYYWADRLGVLVWQDLPRLGRQGGDGGAPMPDGRTTAADVREYIAECAEVMEQRRQAPSIVGWIRPLDGLDAGARRELLAQMRAHAPGRLIDLMPGEDATEGDVIDWHAGDDPQSPPPAATRFAATSEYGRDFLAVPGHDWLAQASRRSGDAAALERISLRARDRIRALASNMVEPGLSMAMFVQLTDVEREHDGLLTYDRRVAKASPEQLKQANDELIAASRRLPAQALAERVPDDLADRAAWVTAGGTWTTTAGGGRVLAGDGPGLLLSTAEVGDIVIEADLEPGQGGGTGVVLRMPTSGSGYLARLTGDGRVELAYGGPTAWEAIASAPVPGAGADQRLTVEARGATLTVSIGEAHVPLLSVVDHRSPAGRIGCWAAGDGAGCARISARDPFVRLAVGTPAHLVIQPEQAGGPCRVDRLAHQPPDSQWRLVPGLADPGAVSLRSCRLPDAYLADVDGRIVLLRDDGSAAARAQATWRLRPGLDDAQRASFESTAHPGEFLRRDRAGLVRARCASAPERSDATFTLVR